VHGLPGSTRDFRYLGGALPRTVRLIRLDLPGFGDTPARSAGLSLEARGRFVVQALDALQIDRCVLAGHSMGGSVATQTAVLAPERVRALALIASVGTRKHRMLRRFPTPAALVTAIDLPLTRWATRRVLHRAFVFGGFSPATPLAEVAQTVRILGALDLRQHAENLSALTVPTLVAWADDDALIEPPIFEELSRIVPHGPRLHWATGGHNLQKSHALELAAALGSLATD
jgi:pimeloyl-ACP methyl ester carboxylesterase